MNQNMKALRLGLVFSFVAMAMLSLFQNCQKGGMTTGSAEQSSTANTSTTTSTNSASTTTVPFNPGPLTNGTYAYAPIRQDQVCQDVNADKKSIIALYIKHLRRCPDLTGLDFWYHARIRAAQDISFVESGIVGSTEYQNRNLPANAASTLYCLTGDTYEILANNIVLSAAQMTALATNDARTFTARCRTSKSQNPAAAASFAVRHVLSAANSTGEAFVCSVPGNALKNHIIDLYLGWLDRCADAAGLDFWAQNWVDDASFTTNADITKYQKCRYPGGDNSKTAQTAIDTCYQQEFNFIMCNAGWTFVKPRHCERMGL
jgi:hypothetical protein